MNKVLHAIVLGGLLASFAFADEEPSVRYEHVFVAGYLLPQDDLSAYLRNNTSADGPISPISGILSSNRYEITAQTFNAFANDNAQFCGLKVAAWLVLLDADRPPLMGNQFEQTSGSASYVWQYSAVSGATSYNSYLAARLGYISYQYRLISDKTTLGTYSTQYTNVVVLSEPPAKSGYKFQGWKSSSGKIFSTSTSYTGADFELDSVHTDGTLVTLNAVWTPATSVVLFNPTGGKVTPEQQSATFDQPYGPLPVPERTGYTFAGWYTLAVGGTQVVSNTVVTAAESHQIYAHWTAQSVTLHLAALGGQVSPNELKVAYDSEYGKLPTPVRTGYTFTDWYTAANGGTAVRSNTVMRSLSEHRLFAQWRANQYSIAFEPNQGEVDPASKRVTYEYTYGALPTPQRTGYTFGGWVTNQNGKVKVATTNTMDVARDHTLYAQWTANRYKVQLDANGGEVVPTEVEVTFGENYGNLPQPVARDYFEFLGWFDQAKSGVEIKASTKVSTPADHTLYAQWEALELPDYRIQCIAAGEGSGNCSGADRYKLNEEILIQAHPATGSEFEKWTCGGSEWTDNPLSVTVVRDAVYYAVFKLLEYEVCFSFQDQYGNETNDIQLVKYGRAATPPPNSVVDVRPGYQFVGWDNSTGYRNVTGNMTIKANYEVRDYTLVYNQNYAGGYSYRESVAFGENIQLDYEPVRNGFKLDYWTNAVGTVFAPGSQAQVSQLEANYAEVFTINLYAVWAPQSYPLTLNLCGGSWATPEAEAYTNGLAVAYGSSYTNLPPAAAVSRYGYDWAGWFTSTRYDTEVKTNTSVTATAAHTLYAKWNPVSVSIGFDPAGGIADFVQTNLSFAAKYVLPKCSRDGYNLLGWFNAAGEAVTVAMSVTNASAHTLTAQWAGQSVTVKFDANCNGKIKTNPNSITVTYGSPYGELPELELSNYEFLGWYTEMTNGTEVANETQVIDYKGHTLYAHWGYEVAFTANGGSFEGVLEETNLFVKIGHPFGTLPVPLRIGYGFREWTPTIASDSLGIFDGATAFEAVWTAQQYTVTCDANGGAFPNGEAQLKYNVTFDKIYIDGPPATGWFTPPTLAGSVFKGWFTDATSGEQIDETKDAVSIPSNHVLYAHWKSYPNEISQALSCDNLTFSLGDGSFTATTLANYNSKQSRFAATNDFYGTNCLVTVLKLPAASGNPILSATLDGSGGTADLEFEWMPSNYGGGIYAPTTLQVEIGGTTSGTFKADDESYPTNAWTKVQLTDIDFTAGEKLKIIHYCSGSPKPPAGDTSRIQNLKWTVKSSVP